MPEGRTMTGVTRGSSPTLIGRDDELARLRSAAVASRDTERCVVLVSGEAGIGKSRLLVEFARSIRDDLPGPRPTMTLRGGCVDVGEGLAYLPILEVLEDLERQGGTITADAASLRRRFGGSTGTSTEDDRDATGERAAGFQRLRSMLADLGEGTDVAVIIDDLHWADRSTLDVVAFLARRLRGSGVLLVLAYRSDELHRRHPLKPVIADLERQALIDHVRLEPLDAGSVVAQITEVLGAVPDPARSAQIVARADGNPFHVEELLSLADSGRLPESLRDVLDARLDQLDDDDRHVIQVAAAIGREVDPGLLRLATGGEVDRALRHATGSRILVSSDDGTSYRFRHALLREAAYDELQGVDLVDAHRRIARALSDHAELRDANPIGATADLARHWLAARSDPEALEAVLEAGRTAEGAVAFSEALAAYEEALTLWDRVDDPGTVSRTTRLVILERASEMAWFAGDTRRALALNRRAQAESDVATGPYRLGHLVHRESWLSDELGDHEAAGRAASRASDLIPAEPPSAMRAETLATLGGRALRAGRLRAAVSFLEASVDISDRIDDQTELAGALAYLASILADLGDEDRALQIARRLDHVAPANRTQDAFFAVSTCVPWIWVVVGDHRRAVDVSEGFLADAESRGLDLGLGQWLLSPWALALFWLGRWDEATEIIERRHGYATGFDPATMLWAVVAMLAAGRGAADVAMAAADEALGMAREGFPEQVITAVIASGLVHVLGDRPATALDLIEARRAETDAHEGASFQAPLLWIAAWAAADLGSTARSRHDAAATSRAQHARGILVSRIEQVVSELDAIGSPPHHYSRLILALASAELERLDDRDGAATWSTLADRFAAIGDLPRTQIARFRTAEAILRDLGDREAASATLREVLRIAATMGEAVFAARADALARAARLDIGDPSIPASPSPSATVTALPVDPWGLSAREREVLALLVDGRTNRQIGDTLFISDKTASVHVTHILDKLGVSSRTEAAVLAMRSGVLDAAPAPGSAPSTTTR